MSSVDGSETVTPLANSVRRTAKMIGVSDRHLWQEIKAGKLKTVRSGKRVLITLESARAYLGLNNAGESAPAEVHRPGAGEQVEMREEKTRAQRR
jgi:hypothetical protein